MKNVQIIDDAINCEYAIYQMTDEEFDIFFPGDSQDVEFIEDAIERSPNEIDTAMMDRIWSRRVSKKKVFGIHATLFYGLTEKKKFYPDKSEPPITNRLVD